MEFLRHYLVAVQHFTGMPWSTGLAEWTATEGQPLKPRAVHWPGVGWLVGLVACVGFAVVGLLLQGSPYAPLAAAVGSTIATVVLTRALHEDALTSYFGSLALMLTLLAKVSLLAVIAGHSPSAVLLALLSAHVVSRFWPLVIARILPRSADADPLADPISRRELYFAAAWCVPALVVAIAVQGVAFVMLALLFSGGALWMMALLLQRRSQGSTANSSGATQQVCEAAFYFGAAIARGAS